MHAQEQIPGLLARLQTETGLTQTSIGQLAGVDRSTANKWMRGRTRPQVGHIFALATAVRERFPHLEAIAAALPAAAGYMALVEVASGLHRQVPAVIDGVSGPLTPAELEAARSAVTAIRDAAPAIPEAPPELLEAIAAAGSDGALWSSVAIDVDGTPIAVVIPDGATAADAPAIWAEIRKMAAMPPAADEAEADDPMRDFGRPVPAAAQRRSA